MTAKDRTDAPLLAQELVERVLGRLGLTRPVNPTLEGLGVVYSAWCQKVPFDNVRKLIHLRADHGSPLPGTSASDFLESWLRFGAGGTCWAGAGALQSLLASLGFKAERGIGTMLAAPDLPPNHGTVVVRFGSEQYLVDASLLHGQPLLLRADAPTEVAHGAWGVRCSMREGRWHIWCRPLHKPDGFECRLERFGAPGQEFHDLYQKTRGWSPFNFQVYARANRGERVVGVGFGQAVHFEPDGRVEQQAASHAQRQRVLIEEVGLSEELVRHLPEDVATPPPPGSRTGQLLEAAS